MSFTLRFGEKKDAKAILNLIKELAVFEKLPNEVDITVDDLIKDGFSSSPKFKTDNFDKLIEKAVEKTIEEFLNTMQSKFDNMIENGRTVVVNITFGEGSDMDMDMDFGDDGDLFSDAMELWFEENAHKGYYHLQGVTATKMILDDVRIPLRDAKGRNYRPSKFAAKLRKYLVSQELDVTRDVQGSKIFITIN